MRPLLLTPGSTLKPQLLTPGSTLKPQLVIGMYRSVRTARPGRAPSCGLRPHRGARCPPRRVAPSRAARPTRPPALGVAVPQAAPRARHDALPTGAHHDALPREAPGHSHRPRSARPWMSWSPPSRSLGSWAWLLGLRPPPPQSPPRSPPRSPPQSPVPMAERRGERVPILPWEGL